MSERDKRVKLLADRYINSLSNKTIYLDADQFSDLADYFFEQGDIDTTFTCLEDGLTIHPDNDQLKIKKIKVLAAEGSYEEASYLMMDVSQQYDFELYFAKLQCLLPTMQNAETNTIEEKIISEETDQLDNVLIDIAYLYIENDNFSKAIDLFKQVKDWEKFSEDIPEFAFCYEMIGEYDRAVNIYLSLIDKDAYSASHWLNLGRLYALKEDYSNSVDALDFSLLNEKDYNAMNLKANCLILLDRTEEAIDIYKEILVLEPENTDILLKLFDCYSIQENQKEADKYLEDYKDKRSKDEEYYLRKINSLLSSNDILEAQHILSEVLTAPDCSLRIVLLHIDILISHNLYYEAYDYLITNKGSIDQEDEEILDRMSYLSIHLNKKELALEYTLKLLLIDRSNKKYKHRLALFLMEEYDYTTLETYLPLYTNEELSELVDLFFKLTVEEANDRDILIVTIKNIIENRALYKSLKY